ncbi:MAG TPA: diguanylate cyclase [Acidobacteriota bacterium]
MLLDESRFFERTPEPGAPSEIEQLRTLIYSDDLTGLYNRRFFRHCISEQKSQSDTTNFPFALLMLDIDHFKQINDTYGHAVGDAALIKVARMLKELLREKGWVFRYAGDEFVAIIRNCNEETAKAICSEILNQTTHTLRQHEAFPLESISLSIGLALYPNDSTLISELMEISDRALYASKRKGRNTFTTGREVYHLEKEKGEDWPIKVECQHFVGRQKEWDRLLNYIAECREGKGKLIFIQGEAGIGKSRLLTHFLRRQRFGDHHVLFGQCTEGTLIHSYAPVRDALKRGFEAKDTVTVNVFRELDAHYRSELISLVPQFDRFEKAPLTAAKTTDRYFLWEAILLLLQGLSRQLPTVMVLEDIHWGDEATLNLLHYLARNISQSRILLIATFREEEAMHSALPFILHTMTRENLFATIPLKPLNAEETGIMVEEIFRGYSVPMEVKQCIYEESEGIPFYVEELLKLLLEEGNIKRAHEELEFLKPEKFLLPYSIRSLIQRRISRLDDSCKRILGYSSIIGYEFSLPLLSKLIEENEGYLLDLLERLTKMQLIRESTDGGEELFEFTHNKIRDVIYEEMGIIKRRKFHQRVGELLESTHQHELELYTEELAHHFEQAGDVLKACNYSLQAGKKALQIHAYNDALMHFNRCFQYKDLHRDLIGSCPSKQLADLYTHKGLALEALGRWEETIRSFELLLTLKESDVLPQLEADAFNHLSRVFYKKDDFSKSITLGHQALEIARTLNYADGISQSCENLGKNYYRICEYDKALQWMRSGAQTAILHNMRAKFLNSEGIIHFEKSEYQNALQCFQAALEMFQNEEEKVGIIGCLVNIGLVRQSQGDLQEARKQVINAFALAQELGDPSCIANCSVNQAELEFKLANYEVGNRWNERAARIYNELDHSIGLTHYLENESWLHLIQGKLEPALEAVQKARQLASDKYLLRRQAELLFAEAGIDYFCGHFQDAFDRLDEISANEKVRDLFPEIELKRGFLYFALQDTDMARQFWSAPVASNAAAETLFWKKAAEGFLACWQNEAPSSISLQQELIALADQSQHAYLVTCARLLCCYQMQMLGQFQNALEMAEDARKRAEFFRQGLWLTRTQMKGLELKRLMEQEIPREHICDTLQTAQQQGQNEIVYRCYRLLSQLPQRSSELSQEWHTFWGGWQTRLPASHSSRFELPL